MVHDVTICVIRADQMIQKSSLPEILNSSYSVSIDPTQTRDSTPLASQLAELDEGSSCFDFVIDSFVRRCLSAHQN